MDALRKGLIKPGAFLFHIDHHADFSLHSPALLDDDEKITDDQEEQLEEFVRTKLSVGCVHGRQITGVSKNPAVSRVFPCQNFPKRNKNHF